MGSFKVGSKIFMLGGEMPWYLGGEVRHRHINEMIMKDVYEFDPSVAIKSKDPKLCLKKSSFIPPMIGPKARPTVQQIGNRIYVLHGLPLCHPIVFEHPSPPFEALRLDSSPSPSWEVPPLPPFFSESGILHSPVPVPMGHFVAGSKLFVMLGELCFFEPPSEAFPAGRWEKARKHAASFGKAGLKPLFFGGVCVSGEGFSNGDVILGVQSLKENSDPDCFSYIEHPVAQLVNPDGSLLCFQFLDKFFPYGLPGGIDVFQNMRFIDQGDGKVCAIMSGDMDGFGEGIFIITLLLRKLSNFSPPDAPIEKTFLKVHVLAKHIYRIENIDIRDREVVNALFI